MKNTKKILIFFIVVYFLIALLVTLKFGKTISVSTSIKYLEALTTIASIIFGVMGVWLSLIWGDNGKSREQNINYVKCSVACSSLVILAFLFTKLLHPILSQILFFQKHYCLEIIRSLLYFFCWIFTFVIIFSLLLVLFSFDYFSFDRLEEQKKKEHEEKIEKRTSLMQSQN